MMNDSKTSELAQAEKLLGGQVEPIILTPEERADMESAIEMAGRDLDCDPAVERPNEPP